MRVLHVLDHSLPLQSGYVFRSLGLLEGQRKLGIETHHLTSPRQEAARQEAARQGPAGRGAGVGDEAEVDEVDGWHFVRTRYHQPIDLPILRELLEMRATAKQIRSAGRPIQPDLLHAHSPLLNGYPALWAARRLGLPLVYEIRAFWEDAAVDHGSTRQGSLRYRTTRRLETQLCRHADAIVTICDGLRRNLIERGLSSDKITVVPNAVDAERFAKVEAPDPALAERLGLRGCPVLGFIGSFYGYEGLPLLIEALPGILAHDPKIRLLLVGGGPDEAAIRAKVAELGLERSVVMTGRVPHGTVLDYYSLVDLFVFPRLSMPLTERVTPLKPLEAMAAGRLVAASDVGGHRELITSGENGLLFRAGDAQALASSLIQALQTPAGWPSMIAAGRRFAEGRRWDRVSEAYKPLYERLCNRAASPAAAMKLQHGPDGDALT
ncbi:MAG: TIGR04063 family PEP-CTERM/XrtA system glycosyltransferase [Geminicoccaceae bacterium]